MWSIEYQGSAEVGPDAVWLVLSDVQGWGSWNAGIETIDLDGPPAVGATFRMTPPGQAELTSTIAELEPGRVLTDVTDLGDVVVRVTHVLAPLADGGTSITYRIEVTGTAADALGAEVGSAVSADFPDVIAALAAAAGSP